MKTLNFAAKAPEKEGGALRFLYGNIIGRCILRLLRAKWLSRLVGRFLDTSASLFLVKHFIKANNINTDDYICDNIHSFNDFFSRKIKDGKRPVAAGENALVSPCDALLSVYQIKKDAVYPVKQSEYTLSSLLRNEELSREFENGYIYVFRLGVEHYHRYCYAVSGIKGDNVHINGTLHTVRPVALHKRPVFCENSREYTVIETENLGKLVQMEVGAMLVGKIKNYHGKKEVQKGEEKGCFLYGGSTVILICKTESVTPIENFLENTEKGLETPIKQGEQINI